MMQRANDRTRPRYEDIDLALWVCPQDHEVREWPFPVGPEPMRLVCSECGKNYLTGCPNPDCPDPVYRWSDHSTKFHGCGAPIPWSFYCENRRELEWPPHVSVLLGQPKPGVTTDLDRVAKAVRADLPVPRAGEPRYVRPKAKVIYQYGGELSKLAAVKKASRAQRIALYFGKSMSKGVEDFVSFIVKWGLIALLVALLALFGITIAFR